MAINIKKSDTKNLTKKQKYELEKAHTKHEAETKKDQKKFLNALFSIFTGDIPNEK